MFGMERQDQEMTKAQKQWIKTTHRHTVLVVTDGGGTFPLIAIDAHALADRIKEAMMRGDNTFVHKNEIDALYEAYPKLEELNPKNTKHSVAAIINLSKVVLVEVHEDIPQV